jgi:hypothetical protein
MPTSGRSAAVSPREAHKQGHAMLSCRGNQTAALQFSARNAPSNIARYTSTNSFIWTSASCKHVNKALGAPTDFIVQRSRERSVLVHCYKCK